MQKLVNAVQHSAYIMQHATCNAWHLAYSTLNPACDMQHTTYNLAMLGLSCHVACCTSHATSYAAVFTHCGSARCRPQSPHSTAQQRLFTADRQDSSMQCSSSTVAYALQSAVMAHSTVRCQRAHNNSEQGIATAAVPAMLFRVCLRH